MRKDILYLILKKRKLFHFFSKFKNKKKIDFFSPII